MSKKRNCTIIIKAKKNIRRKLGNLKVILYDKNVLLVRFKHKSKKYILESITLEISKLEEIIDGKIGFGSPVCVQNFTKLVIIIRKKEGGKIEIFNTEKEKIRQLIKQQKTAPK